MDIASILRDLIVAVFQVAIPAFAATYVLVWWALKQNYFEDATSLKELVKSAKRHSEAKKLQKKEQKKQKKALSKSSSEDTEILDTESTAANTRELNPVHNKWLTFGGGFYGLMALLTYTLIELGEIRDFFSNFSGLIDFLTGISVGLLIDFLVNSIMNLVAAVTWPFYWLSNISSDNPWVWFVVAYLGYWIGAKYAFHRHLKT